MVRDLFGGGAEDVVYFEKQGADRLCGFHCLNNLLQVSDTDTHDATFDDSARSSLTQNGNLSLL